MLLFIPDFNMKYCVFIIFIVAVHFYSFGQSSSIIDTLTSRKIICEHVNTITNTEHCLKYGKYIVFGQGRKAMAMALYSSGPLTGINYAHTVNTYKQLLGDSVNVYCMPVPTSSEFYMPDIARKWNMSQMHTLNNIFSNLLESVKAVNIYHVMSQHASEKIYARTDHHWLPLGAFYAAQAFAKVANVDFAEMDQYECDTIRNFSGTLYKFSKCPRMRYASEDFIFYKPVNVKYDTYAIVYTINRKSGTILHSSGPKTVDFFRKYPDGSKGAYCTFIGGDSNNTWVKTDTNNGRRLLILKDSFGNALPSCLFYSFEEIHIVDCRYFNQNIVKYVHRNKITDVLFVNNVGHACNPKINNMYLNYLKQ